MSINPRSAQPFVFFEETPEWRLDWRSGQLRGGGQRHGWRWVSFAEVGKRMAEWRSSLQELPPGAGVVIAGSPSVEALVADIAVRSLGLTSMPLAGRASEWQRVVGNDVATVIDLGRAGAGDAGRTPPGEVPRLHRPQAPGSGSRSKAGTRDVGGCSIRTVEGRRRTMDAAELGESVERLATSIERGGGRDVVIHGRSLFDGDERVVMEWAIREAAAIVVASAWPSESASSAIVRAAFWARPTVLHGSAADLEGWVDKLSRTESGMAGLRRRFERLRHVLMSGEGRLSEGARRFYRDLGVAVLDLDRGPSSVRRSAL